MSRRPWRADVSAFVATALFGAGLWLPPSASAAMPAHRQSPPPRLAFRLKDQFDREYTAESYVGKIVILVVADREGSEFCGSWVKAIARKLTAAGSPAVQWVSVATLPALPGFMRGFVKRKFPQDRRDSTLMDWGGRLAKKFDLPAATCNVLVFGPNGRLRQRISGRNVDPIDVAAVVAAVAAITSESRH